MQKLLMPQTTSDWKQQKYPGAQRRTIRSVLRPSLLLILAVIVGIIFLLQITCVLGFTSSFHNLIEPSFPIGVDKTATILTAFISLLYARKNFAMGVCPVLAFDYRVRDDSEMGIKGRVFQVKIRNAGSGLAVVSDVQYFLVAAEDQKSLETSNPTEVIKFLECFEYKRLTTYDILVLRPGACLASKEEKTFFETSPQEVRKLKRFDVRISFLGILGDEYIKWIFCVPREVNLSLPSDP
jgi:hypothetical protein